jgi:hypothetical protein
MADTTTRMTAFRLDPALLRRLDTHAGRLSKQTGLPCTRADVLRLLLARALDAAEAEFAQRKKK